jgi:hypothetical protein
VLSDNKPRHPSRLQQIVWKLAARCRLSPTLNSLKLSSSAHNTMPVYTVLKSCLSIYSLADMYNTWRCWLLHAEAYGFSSSGGPEQSPANCGQGPSYWGLAAGCEEVACIGLDEGGNNRARDNINSLPQKQRVNTLVAATNIGIYDACAVATRNCARPRPRTRLHTPSCSSQLRTITTKKLKGGMKYSFSAITVEINADFEQMVGVSSAKYASSFSQKQHTAREYTLNASATEIQV